MLSKKMCLFYDSMIIGKATFIPSIILRSLIFNELTTNHDSIKVVFTKEICIETKCRSMTTSPFSEAGASFP